MLRTLTEWTGIPGSPYYTNLHFAGDDETEAEAAHAITTALWEAYAEHVREDLTANVLPEVSAVDPVTGDTTATFIEAAEAVPGTAGPNFMPPLVQGLVRLRTGVYVGGREIRGKVFLPGTTDPDDVNGIPSAGYLTDVQAVWNALVTDASTAGIPLQVWSPTNGQSESVTAVSPWNQWAVLRSRRD